MSNDGNAQPPAAGQHKLLELQYISKFFGNVTALEDITTSVEAGKVTCVLGDNGAGKSTFIKTCRACTSRARGST